jgi:hypothetical protein
MEFPETCHADTITMYHYWLKKCGDRLMPARADIDPVEMPRRLLPGICLVDVVLTSAGTCIGSLERAMWRCEATIQPVSRSWRVTLDRLPKMRCAATIKLSKRERPFSIQRHSPLRAASGSTRKHSFFRCLSMDRMWTRSSCFPTREIPEDIPKSQGCDARLFLDRLIQSG